MPDTVQFVDSIASSPTVRLDLNDDVTWGLNVEGTDFSPPGLRRAVADTLMVDGAAYPAAAYDDRILRLRLDCKAASVDAIATEVQKLGRELNRTSNILKWQPVGATNPVFFRTIRSPMGAIEELPGAGTFKLFDVQILAEPFAYGLKESISPATVNNDPANGSDGMFFDVVSVKGDVETPLFLSIPQASIAVSGGRTSAIAVRRGGTPSAAPIFFQAESHSLGTDTTLPGNDVTMSGTGSNYARVSFATVSAMVSRVSTSVIPASPAADARGTYRIYARVRKSVSTDGIQMLAKLDGSVFNSTVTLPITASRIWVDLGLIQYPMRNDPVNDGYSGSALTVRGQGYEIQAARTSGAGNLDIDVVLLLPADDRFSVIAWNANSGASATIVDPSQPVIYAVGASSEVRNDTPATWSGLLPFVSPNVTNRVYFVLDVGSTAATQDDKTTSTVVTPYYWPRYLYVKPATT